MDDVQQMIINEVKRLERAIENRTKAIARMEEKTQQRTAPRRYVLEYQIPAGPDALRQPYTRSFVVDKDCSRFFCQDVVFSMAVVGRVQGVINSNKFSVSPNLPVVDFTWQIRDTSTDREWQNTPIPRYFMASGLTAALNMPWPASLRPGAEIEVAIQPTAAYTSVLGFEPGGISSYTLQVSFVGFEVL